MLFHRSLEPLSSLESSLGEPPWGNRHAESTPMACASSGTLSRTMNSSTLERCSFVSRIAATRDLWRPTMKISRPVIALALPIVVAAACSDAYTTPDPQAPAGGSGATAPGATGTPPGPGETEGPAPTGEPDPDMEGGINEGMNIDGPLSGG